MPFIDLTTIGKTVSVAKPIGGAMADIGGSSDMLTTIERIVKLWTQLQPLAKATTVDAATDPDMPAPGRIIETHLAPQLPAPQQPAPQQPAPQPPAPQQPTGLNAALPFIIDALTPVLDRCVKDDPKMTLGAFLTRIDCMDVSELKALLTMYQINQKGKNKR